MALTEKDLHLLEPLMLKRLMLELPLGLQLLLKGAEQMEDLFVEERKRAEFRETDVKLVRLYETAIVAVSLQLSWSFLLGKSLALLACLILLPFWLFLVWVFDY